VIGRAVLVVMVAAAIAWVAVEVLGAAFDRPARPCHTDTECSRQGGGGGPE
jgi:hypothetical protein